MANALTTADDAASYRVLALTLAGEINPNKFICTDPREFKVYRAFQWDARDLLYI